MSSTALISSSVEIHILQGKTMPETRSVDVSFGWFTPRKENTSDRISFYLDATYLNVPALIKERVPTKYPYRSFYRLLKKKRKKKAEAAANAETDKLQERVEKLNTAMRCFPN